MKFNKQLALILGAACLLLVAALSFRNLNTSSQLVGEGEKRAHHANTSINWKELLTDHAHLEELPQLIQNQLNATAKLSSEQEAAHLNESIEICEKNGHYLPATVLKLKKAGYTDIAKDWEKAGSAIYALAASSSDSLHRAFLMQETVAAMDKALAKDEDLTDAALYKGMALADNRNQIMQAVPLLLKVEKQDPDNRLAIYTLGLLSIESGQLDKALQRFEKLVSLQPSNAEYQFQLGQVWKQKGNKEKALQHFEQSLKLTQDPASQGMIENIIKNLQ